MDTYFAVACVILAGCLCASCLALLARDRDYKWAIAGWSQAAARYADLQLRLREAEAQLAKFDHDGDGKPGGSLKRRMTDEELEEFGRQWRSHEDVCTESVSYVDKARGRAEGR